MRGTTEAPRFQCPGGAIGKPGNGAEAQSKFLDIHRGDESLAGYSGLKAIKFKPTC